MTHLSRSQNASQSHFIYTQLSTKLYKFAQQIPGILGGDASHSLILSFYVAISHHIICLGWPKTCLLEKLDLKRLLVNCGAIFVIIFVRACLKLSLEKIEQEVLVGKLHNKLHNLMVLGEKLISHLIIVLSLFNFTPTFNFTFIILFYSVILHHL